MTLNVTGNAFGFLETWVISNPPTDPGTSGEVASTRDP